MKLFKRIFSFSFMLVLGVLFLTSCNLSGKAKSIKIDMFARVYVSQSYDLIAKDDKGEIVTGATWSVSEGEEFAVIQDGKLVPIKAGVFELTVSNGNETDTKKFSAVNPLYWNIRYNLNGGEDSEELFKTYNEFEEGKALATPVRKGYTFLGWYENAEFEGEAVAVVNGTSNGKNIELFAKWELNVYSLEFDLSGADALELPGSYSAENPINALPDASKANYTFLGWFTEEGQKVEELGNEVFGVTKLIAKFEAVAYELSYELNGGSVEGNPATYTVEDEVELVAPTKLGYKFLGWELNGALVSKIEKGTSGALQLVAKWELVVYTLEFDLAGGAAQNLPASYSIEAPVASLPEATKENYTFLGWYDGDVKVEALGAENLGVVKLVAKFEAVKSTLVDQHNAVLQKFKSTSAMENFQTLLDGEEFLDYKLVMRYIKNMTYEEFKIMLKGNVEIPFIKERYETLNKLLQAVNYLKNKIYAEYPLVIPINFIFNNPPSSAFYIGGLGTVNSVSRGREHNPCVQFAIFSKNIISKPDGEIYNYLKFDSYHVTIDHYIKDAVDLFKRLYVEKNEIADNLTENQKVALIQNKLEYYLNEILDANIFRFAKISNKEDDMIFKLIREETDV